MHLTNTKSEKPVVDVLQSKHPSKRIPENLEDLAKTSFLPSLDILHEIVKRGQINRR